MQENTLLGKLSVLETLEIVERHLSIDRWFLWPLAILTLQASSSSEINTIYFLICYILCGSSKLFSRSRDRGAQGGPKQNPSANYIFDFSMH